MPHRNYSLRTMLSIFSTIRTRRMGLSCVSWSFLSPPSLLTNPGEPDGVVEILPGPSERGVVGCETPNRTRNSPLGRVNRKMADSGNEDVGNDKASCQ